MNLPIALSIGNNPFVAAGFQKISITSYLRDPAAVYAKLKKGRNIRASFFNVKRIKLLCSDLQTCGALLTLVNKNIISTFSKKSIL